MLCADTLKMIDMINNINIKISKISKNKYFMHLYDDINTILKNIKINKISIKELTDKPNTYFEDNKFTSENIKKHILTKLNYGYKLKHDNNTIIYYSKRKIISGKIPEIIIHMFQLIKLLKILFNRDTVKNTQKVVYFETSEKKKFPKKNEILGPNEVNSGLTFLDVHKNGDIILYRKEELLKVLIHELIHSNLIDEKIIFSGSIKEFSKLFCVNYNILLNEAFTESFATIINLFYINIVCGFKRTNVDVMFENEMKYSIYICLKIMKYYNIKNISDIVKNNGICINNFPQKTNVFAYYILKNILLSKHIDFGKILNKHTDNYKIGGEECIKLIIKLIRDNITILDNVDRDLELYNGGNSLRLCLYELKI